jgi:hypothetical protein
MGRNSKKLQCRGRKEGAARVFPAEKSGGVRRCAREGLLGGGTRASKGAAEACERRTAVREEVENAKKKKEKGRFCPYKEKEVGQEPPDRSGSVVGRDGSPRVWPRGMRIHERKKRATGGHTGSGEVVGIRCGSINARAEAERK